MKHEHQSPPSPDKVKDPVCGMMVSPKAAKHTLEHGGATYFFCNPRCLEKFRAEPDRYIQAPAKPTTPPAAAAADAILPRPKPPEIRQPSPGACPICGMALEPRVASLDEGPNQ